MKLATELSKRDTGRTLYILDEPTTGLHFEDVRLLLDVLHRLVDRGNTVLVIEHNLDVIKTADWIIDLGPEGGTRGGHDRRRGHARGRRAASTRRTPASYLRGVLERTEKRKAADVARLAESSPSRHHGLAARHHRPGHGRPVVVAHGGRVPARAARALPRRRHARSARASSCTARSPAPVRGTAPTRRSSAG